MSSQDNPISLSDKIWLSPIVTFVVGPEETRIRAHEGVFYQVPYFQKCLKDENFAEGTSKVIRWPDDAVETVTAILQWAYTKTLPAIPEFGLQPTEDQVCLQQIASARLTKVYITADRLSMEEVQKTVIEIFNRFHASSKQWIWPNILVLLDTVGLYESELKIHLLISFSNILYDKMTELGERFISCQVLQTYPLLWQAAENMQFTTICGVFDLVNSRLQGKFVANTVVFLSIKAELRRTHKGTPP